MESDYFYYYVFSKPKYGNERPDVCPECLGRLYSILPGLDERPIRCIILEIRDKFVFNENKVPKLIEERIMCLECFNFRLQLNIGMITNLSILRQNLLPQNPSKEPLCNRCYELESEHDKVIIKTEYNNLGICICVKCICTTILNCGAKSTIDC